MLPVSLDLALLRLQLPSLVLTPGMSVVARVASRGEGSQGAIVLAGALLKASLPDEVREGDTLRLTVAESTSERVVLRLDGQEPATPTATPGAAAQAEAREPDPDGEADGREGAEERPGVSLLYETPALGRLDLRVEQGPEGVVAVIGVPAGAYALAEGQAEALRSALAAATGRPASVQVVPRRQPFDAYA